MLDVFFDALKDAALQLPFLFLVYLIIELMEHKTGLSRQSAYLSGKAAPLLGAAAGLLPMCGFSVMAAKLYEKRYLTLGTLFAVFLATSDEALPVLLLSSMPLGDKLLSVLCLVAGKFAIGAAAGYAVDFFARRRRTEEEPRKEPRLGRPEERDETPCEHRHENRASIYFFSPLWHALEIALVIFVIEFAFGALLFLLGEARVIGFLQGAGYWLQPPACSLIGLVPFCASSVILAEVYAAGGIAFGGLLGGLLTDAGLGIVFLLRRRGALKRGLLMIGALFAIGVAAGYAVNALLLIG